MMLSRDVCIESDICKSFTRIWYTPSHCSIRNSVRIIQRLEKEDEYTFFTWTIYAVTYTKRTRNGDKRENTNTNTTKNKNLQFLHDHQEECCWTDALRQPPPWLPTFHQTPFTLNLPPQSPKPTALLQNTLSNTKHNNNLTPPHPEVQFATLSRP